MQNYLFCTRVDPPSRSGSIQHVWCGSHTHSTQPSTIISFFCFTSVYFLNYGPRSRANPPVTSSPCFSIVGTRRRGGSELTAAAASGRCALQDSSALVGGIGGAVVGRLDRRQWRCGGCWRRCRRHRQPGGRWLRGESHDILSSSCLLSTILDALSARLLFRTAHGNGGWRSVVVAGGAACGIGSPAGDGCGANPMTSCRHRASFPPSSTPSPPGCSSAPPMGTAGGVS